MKKKKNSRNNIEDSVGEVSYDVEPDKEETSKEGEDVAVEDAHDKEIIRNTLDEEESSKALDSDDELSDSAGAESEGNDTDDTSLVEDDSDTDSEENDINIHEALIDDNYDEIAADKKINKQKRKAEKNSSKRNKNGKNKEEKPKQVNIVREVLSLIIYIGVVILLCYFIITYVGCRSRVDGSSMNPTLNDRDSLWVDKLSYTFGDPKRFDIIIFDYDEDTEYVKRIIGMPGETVRIDENGNIYINEQLLHEEYGAEVITPDKLGRASQPVILGKDEYFVLGDNRNHSSDSRYADVGNVNRDQIVGKAVLRIYPFSDIEVLE